MSAIPDEIMDEAEKTLDLMLCNCSEAGDMRADSIMDIAKALLAAEQRGAERERERAARIVDEMGGLMGRTPAEAAAAIRSTKE